VRCQAASPEKLRTEETRILEAPVVIITGASRGIGKAIALTLGRAGCKVSTINSHQFEFIYCF